MILHSRVNVTIALTVLLLLAAWLLIDKCDSVFSKSPKTYSQDTTAIHERFQKLSKELDITRDVLKTQNRAKDSALDLARSAARQLAEERKTAYRLALQLETAKSGKDTVRYIETCDSLALVAKTESDRANVMRSSYESTISIQRGMLAVKDTTIKNQQQMIDTLRIAFKSSIAKLTAANRDLEKSRKKNDRKISLGVGIGYGIGPDGRIFPVAGITLSRSILKFKL